MNDAKRKMMERIKALLAKTIENGCTEGEAFSASRCGWRLHTAS
jgi:hypothetical protein